MKVIARTLGKKRFADIGHNGVNKGTLFSSLTAPSIVVEPTRRHIANNSNQLVGTMREITFVSVATRSIAGVVYTQLGLAVRERGSRGVSSSRHFFLLKQRK